MDVYWENKPYECYLVNNNKYFEANGVKVINAGDGDWSTRARIALEEITGKKVVSGKNFLQNIDDKKKLN